MSGVELQPWQAKFLERLYADPQQRAVLEANDRIQELLRGPHAALATQLEEFMRCGTTPSAAHDVRSADPVAGVRAVVARHLPQEQHP